MTNLPKAVKGDGSIAIVTPSLRRDLELCRTLNRSVLEFTPSTVNHYIIVDRRDRKLFKSLAGRRTIIAVVEEIIPSGYLQIPAVRRWLSAATVVPIHGWLIQQLVKIAVVSVISERIAVMADSDVMLVRDVEPTLFSRDGKARLYRESGGIREHMSAHVEWHQNACKLLNITAPALPANDYIGNLISWDRELVAAMCRHIENASGRRWDAAIASARRISEYLLYGLFVENVPSAQGRVWVDERPRCHTHWDTSPILESEATDFVRRMGDDDISLMVTAHSTTSYDVRRALLSMATNGRLT